MEWPNPQNPQSFVGQLPPQSQVVETTNEWTFEDNKLFEIALTELDPSSESFYENVALKMPWKSVDEIKEHYKALVEDIKLIESGQYPLPIYENDDQEYQGDLEIMEETGASSRGKQRRKSVPWTEQEHQKFLVGLQQFGKGDWRSISRHCVITKTPSQVASHAQKFFKRQTSNTPFNKRRYSINDMQTVDPTTVAESQNNTPYIEHEIPSSTSYEVPPQNVDFADKDPNHISLPKDYRFQSGENPGFNEVFDDPLRYLLPSDINDP